MKDKYTRRVFCLYVVSIVMLMLLPMAAQGSSQERSVAPQDISAKLQRDKEKRFREVVVNSEGQRIELLGRVHSNQARLDAEKIARDLGAADIEDRISVEYQPVPDSVLYKEIQKLLDNYIASKANVFWMSVDNGVVHIGGVVRSEVWRHSIESWINDRPGVKAIDSSLKVVPMEGIDESISEYLQRQYSNTNCGFISGIIAHNGTVELYGVVDDKKQEACAVARAQAAPGVKQVQEHLTVKHP